MDNVESRMVGFKGREGAGGGSFEAAPVFPYV